MLQENVSTISNDSSDIPRPFSFQVIEKIILGKKTILNLICHQSRLSSYFKVSLWYFYKVVIDFFYWTVDAALNTVFIWYFSDYPNKVISQHGEVASKDNRHLSNDILGSTQRKRPHQIAGDVILRIVSPIKGSYPTGFWYFLSIRIISSLKSKYE